MKTGREKGENERGIKIGKKENGKYFQKGQ
jgi:hypothetical protein